MSMQELTCCFFFVCVCVCVCACMRVFVCACVCACVLFFFISKVYDFNYYEGNWVWLHVTSLGKPFHRGLTIKGQGLEYQLPASIYKKSWPLFQNISDSPLTVTTTDLADTNKQHMKSITDKLEEEDITLLAVFQEVATGLSSCPDPVT